MQEVITIRPAELSITPKFQSAVSEAPVNLFRQKITSQSADAKRMSWTWRSPGANLLLSPNLVLEFDIEVDIPCKFSKLANISSISLPQDVGTVANTLVGHAAWTPVGDVYQSLTDGPAVAFGEGNAVLGCCESIQYTINGCSVSHSNWNLFKRSLDTCDIPSAVAQRVFSKCGGAFNRYDEVAVGGCVDQGTRLTGTARGGTLSTAGMTTDSGTQCRLRNFADACTESKDLNAGRNDGSTHVIKILCPLDGAVFNQVYGESGVSRTSIYPKLCLAIPNANSISVTILFKDLEKSIVRRLGRVRSEAGAMNNARASMNVAHPFAVRFKGTEAFLHAKYLRLQAFRSYPDAVSLACMRTQVYQQNMSGATAITDAGVVKYASNAAAGFQGPYLLPSGPDFAAPPAAECANFTAASAARIWSCEFRNCQFAQPPSYLLFVAQKVLDQMTFTNPNSVVNIEDLADNGNHGAALADAVVADASVNTLLIKSNYRNVIQNQDANLSIIRFKLLVQSSVGTFEMSSDKFPYLVDQMQLFDAHKRNCCASYFQEAGMDAWSRKGCCLKLATSDFLHGLGTSFGTAFPITISATVELQNRSTLVTGLKYSDVRSPGAISFQEPIAAKCCMVGIFDRQVLQIASSSAVLSAQNYSAATTSGLLSRRS